MLTIFDFNPLDTTVEIKLAFSYTPNIVRNHISERINTGLLYVLSGEYHYSCKKTSFSAGANSLIYLPANSEPYDYRISETDGKPIQTMQIELAILDDSTKNPVVYSTHPMLLTKHAENSVSLCFKKIITTCIKSDPASRLMVNSDLFKLLSLCAKYTGNAPISIAQQKIAPAIEFIQNNYKSSFTVSELANICYISESQLRRIFLSVIGMSPIKYKKQFILQDACRFLRDETLTIGEISNILGFCDIYAFSHFFYNYKGISPKGYRKSQL